MGSPALGSTDSIRSHISDRVLTWRAISWGPVAQFIPITSTSGSAIRAASAAGISVPSSMVPVVSMVTWAMTGSRLPVATKARRAPITAALICSRSWQVSTIRASEPPAINPSICSW